MLEQLNKVQGETQGLKQHAEVSKAQLADSMRLLHADNQKTAQVLCRLPATHTYM